MAQKSKKIHTEKTSLHARNLHRERYDFEELINSQSELSKFVFINPFGDKSIDFANPDAVKALNKALLKHFYGIIYWDIPDGYLCPPIPGRADYIHYIADLLASVNDEKFPVGKEVKVLDIGVGANCVYPIVGHREYGWSFTGSDVDPVSINSARQIIDKNPSLEGAIDIRLQTSSKHIFKGIIQPAEIFDVTICNPPFHASLAEAQAGTKRKLTNLGLKSGAKPTLNFGGQNAELWVEGGEEAFIRQMVRESAEIANQCLWFTSLISKKTTLPGVYAELKKVNAFNVKTVEMAQGQKVSRFVAWTFLDKETQKKWANERFGK
ncbi:23S rRNA (adenine(1618)-N(6))-methyltransferase RlmF [Dyadobacter sp. CY356]|uniref:23S rRNA (adenine(1618)-N(6))-methyltransferase RlmF n=1 Tax=Dyadobacter sp. CY356 TaxID=2906442 RepID=UPI001F309A80|nr:23S rRNA (adenine(1618)-N(6))-methyltransferase RlmF [Dyadobacter sp. CY356]MCF0058109.1 23S rRNA (adenine(1618)-N(6))-methyltransferase RlmF [Dyadobacter sp. CY356]